MAFLNSMVQERCQVGHSLFTCFVRGVRSERYGGLALEKCLDSIKHKRKVTEQNAALNASNSDQKSGPGTLIHTSLTFLLFFWPLRP